eukprot:CAMPEP_0198225120 /NCGR_PEP_ID=MMETSP1445-20131203/99730_1 /TAXON_ID=36898 /ORGANISM="Pyramimonas sp., Strain CCMP2087" /LENGTH=282 /DNA_ID=CAMNT_0043904521 /DNA_START=315 /DNA_END=1160 /DNA_ORIENTATION=+
MPPKKKPPAFGTPSKAVTPKGKGKGTTGKATTPDASQKTIAQMFGKQTTPKRKREEDENKTQGEETKAKKQDLKLEVDKTGVMEWNQNSVADLGIDADRNCNADSSEESLEEDLKFMRLFQAELNKHQNEVPPQSVCEFMISLLLRERDDSPEHRETSMLAYQNLQLTHALFPHVELAYRDEGVYTTSPYLLRNPMAWAPVDSEKRAKESVVLFLEKSGKGGGPIAEAVRFQDAITAAAKAESADDRARQAGHLLMMRHLAGVLEHDLACRVAVFKHHKTCS